MAADPNITTIREGIALIPDDHPAWMAAERVERELADLRAEIQAAREESVENTIQFRHRWGPALREMRERAENAERRLREATDALRKVAAESCWCEPDRNFQCDSCADLAAVEGTDPYIGRPIDLGGLEDTERVAATLDRRASAVEGTAATPGEETGS